MATFPLKIVTPDGAFFDGEAEKLIVRTCDGDRCLLPRHINFVAPLGMGMATVVAGGVTRRAACIGGMISMQENRATLAAATFEWAEDIDLPRAKRSQERAEAALAQRQSASAEAVALAEARLKRALVRQSVAQYPNN